MNRPQIILSCAVAVILAAISFESGRRTEIAYENRPTKTAEQRGVSSPKHSQSSESNDYSKATIGNIAHVSFAAAYYLLNSASPATRADWAKKLEAMPDGPQKFAAIESFYKTLVQVDASATADLILQLKDAHALAVAVPAVMGAARESDLEIVANIALKVPPRYQGELRDFLIEWAEVDPVSACQFVGKHLDQKLDLYAPILNWADTDPMAAKAWLENLPPENQNADVFRGFLSGWLRKDPEGAINYAVAHAEDERFSEAIREISDQLYYDSGDKARSFVLSLPSGKSREEAVDQVIKRATSIVLGGPAKWERSPKEIANWLITLPPELWNERIGDVLANWIDANSSERDPDSAAILDWIEQLSPETRAQVLASYSPTGGKVQPERVYALAMNITDRELRNEALLNFVSSLATTRDEKLTRLKNLNLSASEKKYLATLAKDE